MRLWLSEPTSDVIVRSYVQTHFMRSLLGPVLCSEPEMLDDCDLFDDHAHGYGNGHGLGLVHPNRGDGDGDSPFESNGDGGADRRSDRLSRLSTVLGRFVPA